MRGEEGKKRKRMRRKGEESEGRERGLSYYRTGHKASYSVFRNCGEEL